MNTSESFPGWYGKHPALGDFASRRLPNSFITPWDTWLQHCIATSRSQLGERWLDLYLTSPIWRFALLPGVIGDCGWAGVLMPSVDKVGRHFPLTLVTSLNTSSDVAIALGSAHDWYASLERTALSALRMDSSTDELEHHLSDNPFPSHDKTACPPTDIQVLSKWWNTPQKQPLALPLNATVQIEHLIHPVVSDLLALTGNGKTLWWTYTEDTSAGILHCCAGMPTPDYSTTMLYTDLSKPTDVRSEE